MIQKDSDETVAAATEGRALKDLLTRIHHEARADNLVGESARVAFYFFLSLFPAIIVVFATTGLVGGDVVFQWVMDRIRQLAPEPTVGFVSEYVRQITGEKRPGLLSIGLVLTLWSASTGIAALTDGMNRMYDVPETRGWWKRRGIAFVMLIAILLLLIGATTAIVLGPNLAASLGLGGVIKVARWPLGLGAMIFLLCLLYYALPARDQRRAWAMSLLGAGAGGLAWLAVTAAFRLYVANFGRFSETYGFVGAVIVLLLWLQLTALAILFGGEVASTVEQWRAGRWEGKT